jgi:hypothetical protein
MRSIRLLLLVVAAAAIAAVVVPAAGALTYPDDICPVRDNTVIKVCPSGETGKAYSYQIKGREGTGCVPEVRFKSVGTMPPGLSINSGGLISGTPTQAGTYVFWINMQDIPKEQGGAPWCADDRSTERQFEITIFQGVQIQQRQSVLSPGQLTVPYSLQFSAVGGTPTWSISAGSLPAGLALASNGLLSGTPTAAGDFTFKVTASVGSRSDTQTYSMSVVPKLQVNALSGVGEVGRPFSDAVHATGGKPGYAFALDGVLPAGLTFNPSTGAIAGTPTVPGNSSVTLTVTDAVGLKTTQDLKFKIAAQLLVTKKPLAAAKVGRAYRVTFRATGGVTPRSWRILGGRPGLLPKGLRLNARTGVLSGVPTQTGTFRLRIQVADKLGAHAALGVVLKVNA